MQAGGRPALEVAEAATQALADLRYMKGTADKKRAAPGGIREASACSAERPAKKSRGAAAGNRQVKYPSGWWDLPPEASAQIHQQYLRESHRRIYAMSEQEAG